MRLEFLLPLQRESWHCTAVGLPLPESKKRLQIVFGLQLFSDSNDQNKKNGQSPGYPFVCELAVVAVANSQDRTTIVCGISKRHKWLLNCSGLCTIAT